MVIVFPWAQEEGVAILNHLLSYPAIESTFNHGQLVLDMHHLACCSVSLPNNIDLEVERAKTGGQIAFIISGEELSHYELIKLNIRNNMG